MSLTERTDTPVSAAHSVAVKSSAKWRTIWKNFASLILERLKRLFLSVISGS